MSDPIVGGPAPGPGAEALATLGQEMVDSARHWQTLNNPDREVAFFQAAATFFLASALAYQNKV